MSWWIQSPLCPSKAPLLVPRRSTLYIWMSSRMKICPCQKSLRHGFPGFYSITFGRSHINTQRSGHWYSNFQVVFIENYSKKYVFYLESLNTHMYTHMYALPLHTYTHTNQKVHKAIFILIPWDVLLYFQLFLFYLKVQKNCYDLFNSFTTYY